MLALPINLLAQQRTILEPVAAYDAFAPYYSAYSETRRDYLRKIEDIVIAHTHKFRSLLDVGAGDGSRAIRIARSANIARLVLLEPSAGMRALCVQACEIWPCGLLEIPDECPPFEAITCLWNVLGHIQGMEQRLLALLKLRRLLAPGGAIFLDVIHRYNAALYGWSKTLLRAAGDLFLRSDKRGDVIVTWHAGGQIIRTSGHVFTQREMERLFSIVGLRIEQRWVIDYNSGRERKSPFFGNLLYKLTGV
jgi:SAM-dependent methyltransferase